MITLNELLERAENEEIAIHTPTEKQAKALFKELDKRGYTWIGGGKLTTFTLYELYEKNTCYDFEQNNKVCYGSLKFYQDKDYTIIEFSEIDFKEK